MRRKSVLRDCVWESEKSMLPILHKYHLLMRKTGRKKLIYKGKYLFLLTLHCQKYLALEHESIMQKLYVPDLYQVSIREHFYWGCGRRDDTRVFGDVMCSSVEKYQTFRSNQLPTCPCLNHSTRRPISVGSTADDRPCPCACQLPKTTYVSQRSTRTNYRALKPTTLYV